MWQKETLYKLQLKINLVQDFCKKAFSESQNYDLVSKSFLVDLLFFTLNIFKFFLDLCDKG